MMINDDGGASFHTKLYNAIMFSMYKKAKSKIISRLHNPELLQSYVVSRDKV